LSTENNQSDYVPIPEGVKGLKIKIDDTAKDAKIAELNQKIGEQEGLIKSMLVRDKAELVNAENKKEFVPHEPKPPTISPETANLENEPSYKKLHEKHISAPIELDPDCTIPLEVKGESVEQIIGFLKKNHELGNKDATRILDKLIRKSLKAGGTYEFSGNLAPTQMRNNKLVKVDRTKDNFYVKYSGSFKKVDED
jgi:hypothetical protein